MLLLAIFGIACLSGWLAYVILGGSNANIPWPRLFVAGVTGSLVGGTLGNLITGDGFDLSFSGVIGSTVGAIIVLAVLGATRPSPGAVRR